MNTRATTWSLTLWHAPKGNVTKERWDEYIARAIQSNIGWRIEGQQEKGDQSEGVHYQLLLKTPQTRWSAIVKWFPTGHVEPAKNKFALQNYVHKDETRDGEFKTVENKFLSWKDVRDKFFEWWVSNHEEMPDKVVSEFDKMEAWDKFIGLSIQEGMEVDVIGVNPQYRSCIQRYWRSYVLREIDKRQTMSVDKTRQTDTEEINVPVIS